MLLLSKLAAIAILIWFYLTAKEKGEPPLKWVILAFIGYWLTWWLVNLTIVNGLFGGMMPKSFMVAFLVNQIPAIGAICASFFIRKKLIADASAEKS